MITHSNFCGKILNLPDGIPAEWKVSNQMFSVMNDIRYVIFTRSLLHHQWALSDYRVINSFI